MPIHNDAAQNALATVGAVFWTIQIVPQIVKSYRDKSTHGLSALLMGIWAFSSYPFSAYIVAQRLSIPLQVQPHAFGFLCGFSVAQCLYYGHGYSKLKAGSCFLGFLVLWAGFETGSVYALWAGEAHGTEAPLLFYGYLSAVMLAIALLPQYWEIYKLKEVVGISLIFMTVDILGGVFSFLSLFFRPKLDIAAFVSYALVVLLDSIVLVLSFILNPRMEKRREREKAARLAEDTGSGGQDSAEDCASVPAAIPVQADHGQPHEKRPHGSIDPARTAEEGHSLAEGVGQEREKLDWRIPLAHATEPAEPETAS